MATKTAERTEPITDDRGRPTLLDLSAKEIAANWVDPTQPLLLPDKPLHAEAHRLQILLARLDKQAENNPAQFNSTTYLKISHAYSRCIKLIKEGKDYDEDMDSQGVDSERTGLGNPAPVGDGTSSGSVPGVSAENPFAR